MSHSDIAKKVQGEGREKMAKRKLYFDMKVAPVLPKEIEGEPKPNKPPKKVFRKGRKPQRPK